MDALVIGDETEVTRSLTAARAAAAAWRTSGLRVRLRVVRRVRRLLAARARDIAATLGERRPLADTLTAELLPLLSAACFLERRAARILAPRRLSGGRPFWLAGVKAEIRREPCGVVLILAPANYPLFLPGVQVLQALVAGNAVCVKPAPGCAAPMRALAAALHEVGLPERLLQVLDDSPQTGAAAVRAGFDRVLLTGSAATGRVVLAEAAARLTPTTMELSGNDAVLVLPGADLAATAACLAYGLRLNGGATCIAPRRVFVGRDQVAALQEALLRLVDAIPPAAVPAPVIARLDALLGEAVAQGARLLTPRSAAAGRLSPILLADAHASMRLLQEDVFAPWLAFVPVDDVADALDAMAACRFGLGASVFGPEPAARALALQLPAGSVCVNDLIMPTADPRLPFGGRGESGFGVTRGAEGLLEMTVIKTISTRRNRFRPHLLPARKWDAALYSALIGLLYGGIGQWIRKRK